MMAVLTRTAAARMAIPMALSLAVLVLVATPASAQSEQSKVADDAQSQVAPETDNFDVDPTVPDPSPTSAQQLPQASHLVDFSQVPAESGMELWQEQHPWHYDDEYLFPLTRGLAGTGLTDVAQRVAMVVTIPLDIAQAPLGALAGLFGP